MDVLMDGWISQCVDEWMDRLIGGGEVERKMGGRVDRWVSGCVDE